MNILPAIAVTSSALDAEKTRLEVIGQNIANAHTTRGPDGVPYQRRTVTFEAQLRQVAGDGGLSLASGPRVAGIVTDTTPGQAIYNPAHPHANEQGMVEMPNVNLSHEMVDLITASRSYEANLSVVRTARQMAQRALQIGR
ncbi:flagellar basal body rod protein FlgC [Opitutales bacterium ASA1]|jgi:flagellar basal-body rod protein FlgC|uniref:flagellar basal body rod protein FlgC n=1 Tax=Congregicoccus parvus TaxID=3081749 RepID=UPI002B30094B|nr:flagellar basal body rod protein FlgC [Opitutales bacterium ASA1]